MEQNWQSDRKKNIIEEHNLILQVFGIETLGHLFFLI